MLAYTGYVAEKRRQINKKSIHPSSLVLDEAASFDG
jgi:hypothetical protein